MDQESFRKLLQTPKATASSTVSRGSLLAGATKTKKKTVDASQPAFKPRAVKKKPQDAQSYRDRASERRHGLDNDYAQVEALAEDFEKRTADNEDRAAVEEQRRYLGGDSSHTVLVKGLDFALLEQNRARLAASSAAVDDASLEQVFQEVATSAPRKRTREEIVQALKSKRAKTSTSGADETGAAERVGAVKPPPSADPALEEAKKAGKFRPIGFKPIGGGSGEKHKKKKKVKAKPASQEDEASRKKAKVDTSGERPPPVLAPAPEAGPSTNAGAPVVSPPPPPIPAQQSETVDDEFDIFADAGEYTGVDLGDEDEGSEGLRSDREHEEGEMKEAPSPPKSKGRWFATEDDDRTDAQTSPTAKDADEDVSASAKDADEDVSASAKDADEDVSASAKARPPPEEVPSDREDGEEEEGRPMRLQPLASSAIPSIRDLLDMDASSGKGGKRGSKKGKKKEKSTGGEGGVDKNKLDRDYKRLKAYTDKKAAAGGT